MIATALLKVIGLTLILNFPTIVVLILWGFS